MWYSYTNVQEKSQCCFEFGFNTMQEDHSILQTKTFFLYEQNSPSQQLLHVKNFQFKIILFKENHVLWLWFAW